MNRRMREGEVGEREKGRKGERERESEGVKANGRGQVFLSDSPPLSTEKITGLERYRASSGAGSTRTVQV